ncbi:Hydroxyacylglutathione mitochondrial, partial [Fasciolopsis buskii]
KCAAVDPVNPKRILDAVKQHGLHLSAVLTTHHHSDHAGGNAELANQWNLLHNQKLPIYGGDKRVEGLTDTVTHQQKLKIGDNLDILCLATPCHTSGHICYYVTNQANPPDTVVFTGDTLFLGGCGRFFEGTADQMFRALQGNLAKLPGTTKVYCGHEYTVKNLQFGLTVEPNNTAMKQRLDAMQRLRASNTPTVPGTIAEELATNPFMRVTEPAVLAHAKTQDPIEALHVIRREKDHF